MAHGRPRDPRKAQQWRQWLDQWRRSGLSVRAFCERHRLAEPSFYAWRQKLQHQAPAPTFLPVHVLPDAPRTLPAALEVVLTGGRCLRIPPGFDPATLRQLLAVLEESPSC